MEESASESESGQSGRGEVGRRLGGGREGKRLIYRSRGEGPGEAG